MFIISGHYCDSKARCLIFPLQKKLNELFEKSLKENLFVNLDGFSLVLCVSGDVKNFNGEGPEQIRYIKKDKEITINYLMPEDKWKGINQGELKKYIAYCICSCFELLLNKAKENSLVNDESGITNSFEQVIQEFLNT